MTGPPTPPITSAIEIEDLSREETAADAPQEPAPAPAAAVEIVALVPAGAVALGTQQQAEAPLRKAFAALTDLAAQGNFRQLVEDGEVADLTTVNDSQLERFLVTVPVVLSYLILDDAAPAIQAILRLPDNLKNEPLARLLFDLSASVLERKYQNVYTRAREVHEAIQKTAIPNADFEAVANGLLTQFLEAFQTNSLVLLSKGYSSLTLASAQTYLGCAPNQVLHVATQNKWAYDTNTQLLSPAPISSNGVTTGKGALAGEYILQELQRQINNSLNE